MSENACCCAQVNRLYLRIFSSLCSSRRDRKPGLRYQLSLGDLATSKGGRVLLCTGSGEGRKQQQLLRYRAALQCSRPAVWSHVHLPHYCGEFILQKRTRQCLPNSNRCKHTQTFLFSILKCRPAFELHPPKLSEYHFCLQLPVPSPPSLHTRTVTAAISQLAGS